MTKVPTAAQLAALDEQVIAQRAAATTAHDAAAQLWALARQARGTLTPENLAEVERAAMRAMQTADLAYGWYERLADQADDARAKYEAHTRRE
jgi:hypothetical protein